MGGLDPSLAIALDLTSQLVLSRSDVLDERHVYRQIGDLGLHDLLVIEIA
jgi:hypothetical protein